MAESASDSLGEPDDHQPDQAESEHAGGHEGNGEQGRLKAHGWLLADLGGP